MVSRRPLAKPRHRTKMKGMRISTLVQIIVLIWSAGVLTAGWLGIIKNADTTFTAGIFTSILANFGVQSRRGIDDNEPDEATGKPAAKPKVKPIVPPSPVQP